VNRLGQTVPAALSHHHWRQWLGWQPAHQVRLVLQVQVLEPALVPEQPQEVQPE
jgi:hypothetical protein